MNKLEGKIVNIKTSGHLSMVSVEINPEIIIKSIVIETQKTANYLKIGGQVATLFKETEVVIGTGKLPNISLQNKIEGTIKHMEKGTLLSKIVLVTGVGELTSIISTNAVEHLGLEERTPATVMIKLNEVMLSKT